MNDEFITRAIENDRYLKATRLIDRFETEIEGEIRRVSEAFIRRNEDLFDEDPDQNFKVTPNAGSVIAHARINTTMDRVRSADAGAGTLKLNITLRWLDPAEYGYSNVDGALCVTGYKINGANSDDHDRVKRRTMEDEVDVEFCRDAYNNAPGLVYVPVENAVEIREGFDTLTEHFSNYGAEYGVDPEVVE